MPVQVSTHTVPTPDGDMPAHLWMPHTPDVSRRPGLVVFQEIFGVSGYIRDRCAALADLGYVVLAPELYWRVEDARIDEAAEDFVQQAMAVMGRLDWSQTVGDGVTALEHLGNLPTVEQVGVVGYCFGGGVGFNVAAESDPALLVSYYGSALPGLTDLAGQVSCPSLHHFGTSDSFIPLEQVQAVRAAVTDEGRRDDVEFHLHEGAEHAFDNPHPMFHDPAASARAWELTTAFLSRYLPAPPH